MTSSLISLFLSQFDDDKNLRDGAFLLDKNVCNLYSSLVNHLQNCTVNPLTLMRILVLDCERSEIFESRVFFRRYMRYENR